MNKLNKRALRRIHRALVRGKENWALGEVAASHNISKQTLLKHRPELKRAAYELARTQFPSFRTWAIESGYEEILITSDLVTNPKKRPRPKTYMNAAARRAKKAKGGSK